MNEAIDAKDLFPGLFQSGELWHCREEFYLILHSRFVVGQKHVLKDRATFIFVTKGSLKIDLNGSPINLLTGMSFAIMEKQEILITEASDDLDTIVYVLSDMIGDMVFVKRGFAIYSETRKNPITVHNAYGIRVVEDIAALYKDVMQSPSVNDMLDVCASIIALYFRLISKEKSLNNIKQEGGSKNNRYSQLMMRFTDMLENFYLRERSVQFYADQLCVTPKYLSVCTKHVTGHTANWWINSYVLRDATQMLMRGNMSVKVVASRLGFGDQMLFGKYFHRQMGVSPTEYRKRELKKLSNKLGE